MRINTMGDSVDHCQSMFIGLMTFCWSSLQHEADLSAISAGREF